MPFITFEGIDGSGKSSLIKKLADDLRKLGLVVEMTQEPGGTSLGTELRQILLRNKGDVPCPEAELLIYEADRAHHVKNKIKPLLNKGTWVLSDRFSDSSLAFQGAGRSLKMADVQWLNDFATGGLKPDLTVLVDCPVNVGHARRAGREADRFENEKNEFHEKVRQEFLKLAHAEPERFYILDSEKSGPEELLQKLLSEMKQRKLL